MHRLRVLLLALWVVSTVGCGMSGNLLGGREKCWGEEQRAASIWRGVFAVDDFGARLDTPEGDAIALLPGALTMRIGAGGAGELVAGDQVVAKAGDDVTLFGGAGADGALVVCAVEEIHSPSAAR